MSEASNGVSVVSAPGKSIAELLTLLRDVVERDDKEHARDIGDDRRDDSVRLDAHIDLLYRIKDTIYWAVGDELVRMFESVGRMNAYRIGGTAMRSSVRWAMEMAMVAQAFPIETRLIGVEWNLYRACAQMVDPQAALEEALLNGWDAAALRRAMRSRT